MEQTVKSIRVTIDGFAQICKDWNCEAHKRLLYAKACMGNVLGVLSPGGGYRRAEHPSEIPPTRQLSDKSPQLDTLKNINDLRSDIQELIDELLHYWNKANNPQVLMLIDAARLRLMEARWELGFLLEKIRDEWYEEHSAEAYMLENGITVEDLHARARWQEEHMKDEDYLTGEDRVAGVPYPKWEEE
jgi:hypothetical protein